MKAFIVVCVAFIACNALAAMSTVVIGKSLEIVFSATGDPVIWFISTIIGVTGSIFFLYYGIHHE